MEEKISKSIMSRLFQKADLKISNAELEKFWKFYQLLVTYNDDYDLTRLKKFQDIIIKHFIDSIYITRFIKIPSPVIDIGTGAGFPGIPLKIVKPEIKIILAEQRSRRHEFLKIAIHELALKDAEIYGHKITGKSFPEVNGVITRALESADKTLLRVNHFLPRNGLVILMKGPNVQDDLKAVSEKNIPEFRKVQDQEYSLPGTKYRRRLLVFTKTSGSLKKTYIIHHNKGENMGIEISSADNAFYREIKKLDNPRGIKKSGKCIVSGTKIIEEVAGKFKSLCESMILHDGYSESSGEINSIIQYFSEKKALYILKKSLYNTLDLLNTGGPLLIIKTPEIPEWDSAGPGCSLAIPFQDPVNSGSVIRTAAGFDISRIILLKEAAHPFHPKSIRTSAGSVFTAPLSAGPSIEDLPGICENRDIPLITLEKDGTPITDFEFPENFILLPGIEGPGLPGGIKSRAVSIPVSSKIESLNAAVAVSIALFHWRMLQDNK